ncbi:Neuromedin-U [Pteropus alecto]|uniref:Neuromedin-U n=1 Tax=Pteropus alecto TaxID=9402 RepID=L5JWH1_PTEAL|nr:Neuromedin-U [Pteropus alecto]
MPPVASRRPGLSPGQAAAAFRLLALLLLLSYCARACRGAPILLQGLQPEQELQLWNEIDATCSSFLSIGSQPQVTNALEELCLMIMGTLPKSQSSVVHPLLQLVPQLYERRMKRFKVDVRNMNCMLALTLCVGQFY